MTIFSPAQYFCCTVCQMHASSTCCFCKLMFLPSLGIKYPHVPFIHTPKQSRTWGTQLVVYRSNKLWKLNQTTFLWIERIKAKVQHTGSLKPGSPPREYLIFTWGVVVVGGGGGEGDIICPHLMTRLKIKSITHTLSIHYNTLRAVNDNWIILLDVVITCDTTPSSSHSLSQQLLRPEGIKHAQMLTSAVTSVQLLKRDTKTVCMQS